MSLGIQHVLTDLKEQLDDALSGMAFTKQPVVVIDGQLSADLPRIVLQAHECDWDVSLNEKSVIPWSIKFLIQFPHSMYWDLVGQCDSTGEGIVARALDMRVRDSEGNEVQDICWWGTGEIGLVELVENGEWIWEFHTRWTFVTND